MLCKANVLLIEMSTGIFVRSSVNLMIGTFAEAITWMSSMSWFFRVFEMERRIFFGFWSLNNRQRSMSPLERESPEADEPNCRNELPLNLRSTVLFKCSYNPFRFFSIDAEGRCSRSVFSMSLDSWSIADASKLSPFGNSSLSQRY